MSSSDGPSLIDVAVACDEAYAMALAAMLASAVRALHRQYALRVHALCSGLSADTWRKLRTSVPENRVRWNPIGVPAAQLEALDYRTRTYEHISAVTFFRLLLADVLPAELEKVLYLDCDLVVLGDLAGLWQIDLGELPLAAVAESNPRADRAGSPEGLRLCRQLGIDADQQLFNAGVMLLNIAHWRRHALAHRAFNYIREAGPYVRWYEQEALNVVTGGEYLELPWHWNVPAGGSPPAASGPVSILHYLTANKPWHWRYGRPDAATFFDAVDATQWAGWRPTYPRHGAAARVVAARLLKALRKRSDGARRLVWAARRKVPYWGARLRRCQWNSVGSPPKVSAGEVRLFVCARAFDATLVRTLAAHFSAGIERAIVLLDVDAEPPRHASIEHVACVHAFAHRSLDRELAMRRLLELYGRGHWCVLGREAETIVDEAGAPADLRALCGELDAVGQTALEAGGLGEPVGLVGRDARSGRIFTGTARIERPAHSTDRPAFVSRIVLVRYHSGVLLDAGATLVGNVRKSGRYLGLKRAVAPGDA